MPFLHKRDDPLTKCHRMWLTHLKPPYLPCRQGITNQASWESESESSQPALVRIARDALERIGPTLERVRFRITGRAHPRHDIAQSPDTHLRQGDLCAPAQPVAQTGHPFRTENSNTDERKAE